MSKPKQLGPSASSADFIAKDLSPRAREAKVLDFWDRKNVFKRSLKARLKGKRMAKPFVFYEGPPSANGLPGAHHILGRAIKDTFCRYKAMTGFYVPRRAGWDAHGLPIELAVEQQLGITKRDIGHSISIKAYNEACRAAVTKYKKEWDKLTKDIGFWLDLDAPYITYDRQYIETVWQLLSRLYKKKLLYEGYSIQPYSPAAGTSLSQHELNQPGCYKEVKDLSIVVQFKIKDRTNEYFLSWTTTPWTLPANNALAVGSDVEYVRIQTINPYTFVPVVVILAARRMTTYFPPEGESKPITADFYKEHKVLPYKIIDRCKGSDLVGISYEQLMPYIPIRSPALQVYAGDFVTSEEGTGVVHIASTFGADDYALSKKECLPEVLVSRDGKTVPIVDESGRFVDEVVDFSGRYVKAAYGEQGESVDLSIAMHLKKSNQAFRIEKFSHTYPHCWRTDKPIIYYPVSSWFIKTTAYKKALIAHNKKITWHPKSMGAGRFGDWLEHLVDWNVGRTRFWGTPLPIWSTEDGTEQQCIGSYSALRRAVRRSMKAGIMTEDLPANFDPHRPYIDEVILCSTQGKRMYREEAVIDVWFDSGAMPYAQQHYPFRGGTKALASFPADFIAEGVDQTRGWFFSLHALGVMLFRRAAFKQVFVNGLLLDARGNKMSKRLGNMVDVSKLLNTYGADAVRWYFVSQAHAGDDVKFTETEIATTQRLFFGTLLNTYHFFALYANIDRFTYRVPCVWYEYREETDQWVLSALNTLVRNVRNFYEAYRASEAVRLIQCFVLDDLSNWYVRLNRERFWQAGTADDSPKKRAAYETLYECLFTVAQLMAPVAPFMAESIYQALRVFTDKKLKSRGASFPDSVHLCDFPTAKTTHINKKKERVMVHARKISSMAHAMRKKAHVKVRQTLVELEVYVFGRLGYALQNHKKEVGRIIAQEVNVAHVKLINGYEKYHIARKVKPVLWQLKQTFGEKIGEIVRKIGVLKPHEIEQLELQHSLELPGGMSLSSADGVEFYCDPAMKEEGDFLQKGDKDFLLRLNVKMDSLSLVEGFFRELSRKIQNLRKQKGFAVTDKIMLRIFANDWQIQNVLSNASPKEQPAALTARKNFLSTVQATIFIFEKEKEGLGNDCHALQLEVYMPRTPQEGGGIVKSLHTMYVSMQKDEMTSLVEPLRGTPTAHVPFLSS